MSQKDLETAVLVMTVKISKPGASRKVSTADVRVRSKAVEDDEANDAEEESLHVSKDIIRSADYAAIKSLDSGLKSFLNGQCIKRLGNAQRLVLVSRIEEIDAHVTKRVAERVELVEKFIQAYPAVIEDAKARLGDLFCAKDFPSAPTMREAFSVETSIASLPVPGSGLANVSKALYSRELRKVQAAREKMVAEIRDGLRLAMAELVTSLVSKLAPTDGSKPKVMANQVEKLQSFLTDFSSLNVAGDDKLEALVEQAREMVTVDPSKLRASPEARNSMVSGLRKVRDALDGMISSDANTLRGAALELSDTLPEQMILAPVEANERFSKLDLSDNAANAKPAPETDGVIRPIELEDSIAMAEEPVRVSRSGLDLD